MTDTERWIRDTAAGNWPLLWPLRRRHGDEIRAAVASLPEHHTDVRAAFGVGAPPAPIVAATLYADLYRDESPAPPPSWDVAIGALRRGEREPLRARVAARDGSAHEWCRAWYDVSTLAGRIAAQPRLRVGESVVDAGLLMDPPLFGGGPTELVDANELGAALGAQLDEPFTIERHRAAAAASVDALVTASPAPPIAMVLAQLLALHADDDAAAPFLEGFLPPPRDQAFAMARAVQLELGDAARVRERLERALASRLRARRWFAFRLLAQEGAVPVGAHPDDRMPAPPDAPVGLF